MGWSAAGDRLSAGRDWSIRRAGGAPGDEQEVKIESRSPHRGQADVIMKTPSRQTQPESVCQWRSQSSRLSFLIRKFTHSLMPFITVVVKQYRRFCS